MTGQGRFRLTVEGAADVVVDLDAPSADAQSMDGGNDSQVSVYPLPPSAVDRAGDRRRFDVMVDGWHFTVRAEPAARGALRAQASRAAAAHQAHAGVALRAQIPGGVIRLWVADGDQVEEGQPLLAIEAMKMENEIRAPRAGRVDSTLVGEGQLVERGEELLNIL